MDYSIKAGQRTINPIEKAGRIVRIDTMIPKDPAPSCSDAAGEAFNYLVEPLTGGCKSQTTLDTNGDGKINDSDSTACVFSTTSDGVDTVLNVSAAVIAANDGTATGGSGSSTTSSDLRMVESGGGGGGNGKKLIRVDDINTPPVTGALKATQRAWRQIFMR
jgi:Tfp pilus tip-associated adhesin PilY1